MSWHELTGREKVQIRRTVKSWCRYFRECLLPDCAELMKLFSRMPDNLKECAVCGRNFVVAGNKRYCSDLCADSARKKAMAARVRRLRAKRK